MRTRTVATLCCLAVACLLATTAPAATQYTINVLNTTGTSASHAWDINESGQVVGWADLSDGSRRAVRWQQSQMYNLGTLGGTWSEAYGINNGGEVVGDARTSGDDQHAFAWLPTTNYGLPAGMNDLGVRPGGYKSSAVDINDSGRVVGRSSLTFSDYSAHMWDLQNGTITDLGTLGGTNSYAYGLNQSGQIVGRASPPTARRWHAFLWEDGEMHDLGTLGGTQARAYDINDLGQVAGHSYRPIGEPPHYAFLWLSEPDYGLPAGMNDLGSLGGLGSGYHGSEARGINNTGQVVGMAATVDEAFHAFVWQDGVMYDLNDLLEDASGWELTFATAINDAGQIVGQGTINGEMHAFMLTPVPEPSALVLVGFGALGLLRRIRARSLGKA